MTTWKKKGVSVLLVVLLLMSCFAAAAPRQAEAASVSGQAIVNKAMEYVGKVPYVYGGEKIDGSNPGADCSGFICRIYEKFGINMWSVRTHLRDYGTNIGTDLNQAQVGDIIWFTGHVAIYAGKSGGHHMIVHETGGSYQNVAYTRVSVVNAELKGIIRIPGVNGNTAAPPAVIFSKATDPNYTKKASISNTNAVVVQKITKPSGTNVTKMGVIIYQGNTVLKKYTESVSTVTPAQTTYHSWYDINKEVGLTLEPGTTYGYQFFGVFNGVEVKGAKQTFTTTGSASNSNQSYLITFYANPEGTTQFSNWCKYGQTISEVFGGDMPSAQVPEGYQFKYWYVKENGQNIPIGNVTTYRWTSDIIVYPSYEKLPDPYVPEEGVHDVFFVDSANMVTYGYYHIKNGDTYTLPATTPTRNGYEFIGWFTEPSGGTKITAGMVANLDADVVYYAQFRKVDEEPQPEPDPGQEPQPEPSGDVKMTLNIGNPVFTVNGERQTIDSLGTTPIIRNGRTLLPVRAVIEGMGGTVDYDNDTRVVTLVMDGHSLYLMLDDKMAWDSRNDYYMLDVAPVSIGGRTMLPIRFVVEYFGGQVDWDNATQTVTITK